MKLLNEQLSLHDIDQTSDYEILTQQKQKSNNLTQKSNANHNPPIRNN